MRRLRILWLLTLLVTGWTQAAPHPVDLFLGTYCLDCHDADVQKGERDFESFFLPLKSEQDWITAKEIVDQITLKEMPPPKASQQPTDEERLQVVRLLRESMADARDKLESTGSRTVLRRLSTREYENTLATLFNRRVDTLGLTVDFPQENTSHHMDTIGESLITSGFLLDQYFQAAHRLVELRLRRPPIPPKTWHFTDNFRQYEELNGPHKAAFNFEYLCLYEQPNSDTRQGGYGHIEDFLAGVPVSGLYEVRTLAQAMHRDTHYDPEIFRIDFSEPFLLNLVPGDVTKGHIHYPQSVEPLLAEPVVVPDDKPEWLTFQVWLEKGQTPRFIFPNGPFESRASISAINKRYKDEFTGEISRVNISRTHILRQGKLPHIRIGEIKVKGPLPEPGGTKEERAVFGQGGFQPQNALDQLYAFGERAYRRPLTAADQTQIRDLYEKRIREKAPPRQAALDTVVMILCSPSFLYLSEVTPNDKDPLLGPYDLASRLSYTLWAAPPDAQLLQAAASKKISSREDLTREIRRLLADQRSAGFVHGFLESWLNLRDLGGMPPPRREAKDYYGKNLPVSMKGEARQVFAHLLRTNGPVTDLLDADYTFVDKSLAELYDLPQKNSLRLADGFQKVSLQSNRTRGGVLGMAGVLTVSANGVETSPVTRGVWVSENLLGITPPPPPDEVPAIDSDVSSATTIKQRLALHSEDKSCGECHRKIDPLGFPLESFDPIGRWRTHYPKPKGKAPAPKIDPSGEFASGESFAHFEDFKELLKETRSQVFTRHLLVSLLSYATGRHMEIADEWHIDELHNQFEKQGGGLQDLLEIALTSKNFRSR
ncbi:MAG: DUF1592 domain-containing protein [Verrucomicrobiota bacterium]